MEEKRMRRAMSGLLLAFALAAPAVPVAAQQPAVATKPAGVRLSADEQLKSLRADLAAALNELQARQEQVKAGRLPATDLAPLEARVEKLKIAMAAAERQAG